MKLRNFITRLIERKHKHDELLQAGMAPINPYLMCDFGVDFAQVAEDAESECALLEPGTVTSSPKPIEISVHVDTHAAEMALQKLSTEATMLSIRFGMLKSRIDLVRKSAKRQQGRKRKK